MTTAAVRSDAPAEREPLRIVSPPNGAVYLIDPTLRRDFQSLPLRTIGAGRSVVEWRVDGQTVGRVADGAAVDWSLVPGRHVITAHDARGRQAETAVVVK
jgi:membrane carboxypeptidase/penicillin-binding protein PbpC